MANYFTHFSCLLPVGSATNMQTALALYQDQVNERAKADEIVGFAAEPSNPTVNANESAVWLYSEENGEPEDVIAYVLRCAEALNLTAIWGFRWCLSCSRPRLDGYGGGAQILDLGSRKTLDWIDLDNWLNEQADAYQLARQGATTATNAVTGSGLAS